MKAYSPDHQQSLQNEQRHVSHIDIKNQRQTDQKHIKQPNSHKEGQEEVNLQENTEESKWNNINDTGISEYDEDLGGRLVNGNTTDRQSSLQSTRSTGKR